MKKLLAVIMSVALLFGTMSVIASAGLVDSECQCEEGCQGCIDNACHLAEKDCTCNPPEEELNGFAAFWSNLFDWLKEAFRSIGIEFQEFQEFLQKIIDYQWKNS